MEPRKIAVCQLDQPASYWQLRPWLYETDHLVCQVCSSLPRPRRGVLPPVILREVEEDVHLVVLLQQAVGSADVVVLQHSAVIVQDGRV